jgi:hypothetical protein
MQEDTDFAYRPKPHLSNRRLMGDKPSAVLSRARMKRVEDALRILTGE